MKRKILKWALIWATLGAAIPAVLILRSKLISFGFGQLDVILWPSSIFLMGLDGPDPRSSLDIVEVYAILIAENVALYTLVGLLTCPLLFLILRKRNRTPDE